MKRRETQSIAKHDLDNRSRQPNPRDKDYWQYGAAQVPHPCTNLRRDDGAERDSVKPD
jgi:hypothetical protein